MSRKSLLLTIAIILVLGAGGLASMYFLVRYEPGFYQQAVIPAGESRKKWSTEFRGEFANELVAGILNEVPWSPTFTQAQVNAYFAEDFLTNGGCHLPEGFSEPRVTFEDDRIRVGFRYGDGAWSTVISADLKIWLAANESNVIVLEVEGLYAGGMPISSQTLLERFAETARRQEMEVTWYRLNGHPVALLRFQPGKKDPTVQLRYLKIQNGMLQVAGGPTESRSRTTPVSAPSESQ